MGTQSNKNQNSDSSRYMALFAFASIVISIVFCMLALFGPRQTFEDFVSNAFGGIVLSLVFAGVWGLYHYYDCKRKSG